MAAYVNGAIGKNGAIWMMPSHYLKQFHPDYGKNVPKDWDAVGGLMETKADWHRNPDCPTMTGFRCKSFDNTSGVVLERNPYYWCVMPNGDQLPYVDEIQIKRDQRPRGRQAPGATGVGRLLPRPVQPDHPGRCPGPAGQPPTGRTPRSSCGTADRAPARSSSSTTTTSTTSSAPLIREPKFRQAVSHAFNREAVQKSVYFNTGEPTTGTHSPKASEFQVNDTGGQLYRQWRDAYVEYDPEKAKQLLDELGVKDTDGDGVRELPNGKKLELRLDVQADAPVETKPRTTS